ncbi:abc transporter family protein [Stylonychia lemnae]|uniref:Abc transporter family protein n=1 Tax=Stylonychia lemnae TaxID=5949 RepID=A0A078API6_STYLE|nr:abc transporter family protein [Stylonychia lemnae]|eukprot:CDW82848.1 abc transporter family protein [Stylonychia lemnae]
MPHSVGYIVDQFSDDENDLESKIEFQAAGVNESSNHSFTSIFERKHEDLAQIARDVIKIRKNSIKLTFKDVRFEITNELNKDKKKDIDQKVVKQQILKNVTGYAMPGQTLYIMGSSGAGKTSLLNILSDRTSKRSGTTIEGQILINDKTQLSSQVFGSVAGYVMQDDILFAYFTPKQALTFAARLKLNQYSQKIQDERVESLLEELELKAQADTIIGSQRKKMLSGGERKRVSIGVELITDPSLILLDEPTSGLDSFKALKIVKLLNRQARKGKTVISTIHQPGSEQFALFDRLIFMCDGQIIYQGEARLCQNYFAQIGLPLPRFSNPSDYIMKLATVNYPKERDDEKKIKYLMQNYEQIQSKEVQKQSSEILLAEFEIDILKSNQASSWKQFKVLIERSLIQAKYDPHQWSARILQTIFIAILSLGLFRNLSNNDFSTQIGLAGFLFFTCIQQLYAHSMSNLLAFQEERPVFLREFANKMYGIAPYYLSKSVVEIPVLLLQPFLWEIILYFGVGLSRTKEQFGYFYLILTQLSFCASSLGIFSSSLFNNSEMAVTAAPVLVLPLVLFSGFFSNSGSYPTWIGWIQYLSPIRYTLEAFIYNEFGSRDYLPDERQIIDFLDYKLGMSKCLWIVFGFTIIFRIITGLSLRALTSKFQ